ncbi:MAG: hypothetical protein DCC67_18870 [Planctomycetota bacterium]|nr:MAG: hypothetical protein DCC67_18870 [Planctomycetota bacterium]
MKLSHLRCVAMLVLGLVSVAAPARASIELQYIGIMTGSGLTTPMKFNGAHVTASAGQLHWEARNDAGVPSLATSLLDSPRDADSASDNLITFCIELSQVVSSQWRTYDKTALHDAPKPSISGNPLTGLAIGAARAAALDRLADNFWNAATGTSLVDSVAFQLAVWEIVHESPSLASGNPLPATLSVSYNAGSHFVNKSTATGTLLSAITQANNWLSQLASNTLPDVDPHNEYTLLALTNNHKQDQLVRIYTPRPPQGNLPVPEPAAMAVWLLLGGAAGAVVLTGRTPALVSCRA